MNWRIELTPSAEKQYLKLDATTRRRLRQSLLDLQNTQQPLLHPRVRALTGKLKGDYRVRVGTWRILLTPDRESRTLRVYAVRPADDRALATPGFFSDHFRSSRYLIHLELISGASVSSQSLPRFASASLLHPPVT